MHHQDQIGVVDRGNANKVSSEDKGLAGDQGLVDGLGVGHHEQGVAVGGGLGYKVGADDGPRTWAIFHQEGLTELFLELGCQIPRVIVGYTTRGEGDDDFDGFGGVVRRLGAHPAGGDQESGEAESGE